MQRIIFFDGLCPLCDFFASYVYSCDTSHRFLFASLQSKTAQDRLSSLDISPNTVVYLEDGHIYLRSEAILRIFITLDVYASHSWAPLLIKIPSPLRDLTYRLIARYRYLFFSKKETCRISTSEEKKYFLD